MQKVSCQDRAKTLQANFQNSLDYTVTKKFKQQSDIGFSWH